MSAQDFPCPYCDQSLGSEEVDTCPHCGNSVDPPVLWRYEAPLVALEEVVRQASSGHLTPAAAQEIFNHLTGVVQQTLDLAREDLQYNLKKALAALEEVPEEARHGTLDYARRFEQVQRVLGDRLVGLSEIWSQSDLTAGERSLRAETALAHLRSELADLEQLVRETSHPELMMVPDEPLPDEVGQAIEHFARSMDQINLYCAGREKSDLEGALVHLDEARRLLKLTLMMDAYGA